MLILFVAITDRDGNLILVCRYKLDHRRCRTRELASDPQIPFAKNIIGAVGADFHVLVRCLLPIVQLDCLQIHERLNHARCVYTGHIMVFSDLLFDRFIVLGNMDQVWLAQFFKIA